MAQERILYQIDAFTKEKFSGNPAGVVLHADGLSDSQMQSIAAELKNSETAFLFSGTDESHDAHIRYFTPTTEVPSCGHATIASLYALALQHDLNSTTLRMKTGIGVLPLDIEKREDGYKMFMTQGKVVIKTAYEAVIQDEILSALGLTTADLNDACPIQYVSTGNPKVIVGINSREKLNSLKPDMAALLALSDKLDCPGYFVFTFDTPESGILTNGRMFAPKIGISEDPVTGNANGPLGAYLVHNQLGETSDGELHFLGMQGEAMGRPGIVEVYVTIENSQPVKVKIAGDAVVIFKTSLTI